MLNLHSKCAFHTHLRAKSPASLPILLGHVKYNSQLASEYVEEVK